MMEMQAYAQSDAGMKQAENYLSRNASIENRLMLSHARMDRLRMLRSYLEKEGADGREKEHLLQEMQRREKEILADLQLLLRTEKEIENTVRSIGDDDLRTVLEMRYLHHMHYWAIAEKMHLDERHIYRLRKKALQRAALVLLAQGKITA